MKLHDCAWKDGKPRRKLTEQQIRAIRKLREQHGKAITYKQLGAQFGISDTAARHICKRLTYGDVE